MEEESQPHPTLASLLETLENSLGNSQNLPEEWKSAASQFSDHANSRRVEFLDLFGGREPEPGEFYARIERAGIATWTSEEAARLIGSIWALAVQGMPVTRCASFLDAWFGATGNLFNLLRSAPQLVAVSQIPASIAEAWFLQIYQRVKNDGANPPFFESVAAYARSWHSESLKILDRPSSAPFSEGDVVVMGTLLFGLYQGNLTQDDAIRRDKCVSVLSQSKHVSHRTAVFRALRCRLAAGIADAADTALWFRQISAEVQELRIEGFRLGYVAADRVHQDRASLMNAIEWIEEIAFGTLSEDEKQQLLGMLGLLLAPKDKQPVVESPRLLALLSKVLPLSSSKNVRWGALDFFFLSIVENAPNQLGPVFRVLASDPERSLVGILRDENRISALRSALISAEGVELISSLCFSADQSDRELGLVLFERSGQTTFSKPQLAELDERTIILSLYQFQRMPALNEFASRYLLALLPRIETCSEDVQSAFYEELLYQAKNLPKGCLEFIKKYPEPPVKLRDAIAKAEAYFEQLRAALESPVGQMSVPGLRVALREQRRRFNAMIDESMRRGSGLLELCHNVRIVYGDSFSQYHDGMIAQAAPMTEFSHEMEIPRFLVSDPEGSAIRRLGAGVQISQMTSQAL